MLWPAGRKNTEEKVLAGVKDTGAPHSQGLWREGAVAAFQSIWHQLRLMGIKRHGARQ